MKTELIFGIVSGICLVLGGLSYLVYYKHYEEKKYKKFGFFCAILVAFSIGLLIGITNKPHEPGVNSGYYYNEEEIENETINYEGELDP